MNLSISFMVKEGKLQSFRSIIYSIVYVGYFNSEEFNFSRSSYNILIKLAGDWFWLIKFCCFISFKISYKSYIKEVMLPLNNNYSNFKINLLYLVISKSEINVKGSMV